MQRSPAPRDDARPAGPALVIVTGLPASGKSTLVARLRVRTGLEAISKDVLKEALFARLGTGDAAWSRQLSDAAFAGLFAQAAARLEAGLDALIEGNFRAGEHEGAILGAGRDAQHRAATRFAQVLCRIDEPLRLGRLEARAAGGLRHAGHLDAQALAALRTGHAAGPGSPSDRFLDLPGARFVYDPGLGQRAEALEAVLDALDGWLAGR